MFDGRCSCQPAREISVPGRGKKPRGKPAPRWQVEPLRRLEADVYPTPPTDSLDQSSGKSRQKTKRRRPPRPSKG